MNLTSFYSRKKCIQLRIVKASRDSHPHLDRQRDLRMNVDNITNNLLPLSPDTHWSHGSWESQWSRNQQVPLSPLTAYQVNQLHSGLPPHMSWHWPAVTSCTMSRLLSSVMSHDPAVNTPHSSGKVVEVEGAVF